MARGAGGVGGRKALGLGGLALASIAGVAILVSIAARPTLEPPPTALPDQLLQLPAPTVWYSVIDADSSTLYTRRLDGRSMAQLVADRPSTGNDVVWDVEPDGRALLVLGPTDAGLEIEGLRSDGAALGWTALGPIAGASAAPGVWSSDGRRWAIIGDRREDLGKDLTRPRLIILDVPTGVLQVVDLDRWMWPQGFLEDGRLVLTERIVTDNGWTTGWTTWVVDPGYGSVGRIPMGAAVVGPRSSGSDDVAPAAGLGVHGVIPDPDGDIEPTAMLELVDLGTGESVGIGPPHVHPRWTGFTADGLSVLAFVAADSIDPAADDDAETLLRMERDGSVEPIWTGGTFGGNASIRSSAGDYVGWSTWDRGSHLWFVELDSGRGLELPLPERNAGAAIHAIIGGWPLPPVALAPEPPPSATPLPVGPPIPGAPTLVRTELERRANDRIIRVALMTPAQGGGLATLFEMSPIPIAGRGGDDWPGSLEVAIRPDGKMAILTFVDDTLDAAWVWTVGGDIEAIDPPGDVARRLRSPSWRPDGSLVVFSGEVGPRDEPRTVITWFEPGSGRFDSIAMPDDYDRMSGWAPDGTSLLMGHVICTEGCPGRYAYAATLDLRTGDLHPAEPGETALGLVSFYAAPDGAPGTAIVLDSITREIADDRRFPWPFDLPSDGNISIFAAPNGVDLLVTVDAADVTTLYRLIDPLATATPDVAPIVEHVGRLARGLDLGVIDSSLHWATARDRTGVRYLVDLSTETMTEIPLPRDAWLEVVGIPVSP